MLKFSSPFYTPWLSFYKVGADDQVQAVEGPLPVPVLLVGVHDGDGEEQQELHGQL